MQYSGLSLSLPKNVHLLTFEPWRTNSILVRFEHILAKNEDQQYSEAVTFDFQDVFRGLSVASIRETTLSANQWLDKANRLQFTSKTTEANDVNPTTEDASNNRVQPENSENVAADDLTIELKPMQIRTFVVELKPAF